MSKIQQRGFTLIELVVVIVILGILAATALPKFVNLQTDAQNAAAQGVAAAVTSATSMNYAKRLISSGATGTVPMNTANVCATAAAAGNVMDAVNNNNLVSGISLTATAPASNSQFQIGGTGDCSTAASKGTTVTCTITPQGTGVTAANAFVTCSS